MSIASLTTVAAARDTRAPTKRDAGKSSTSGDTTEATTADMLVSQVPTELVAPYTAVMAAIAGFVAKPTKENLHPDQLTTYRWIALALLLVGTFVLVWRLKQRKSPGQFPLLETFAAVGTATAWAFVLPASPLTPYLHSSAAKGLVPLLIGFGGVVFAAATGLALRGQRGT